MSHRKLNGNENEKMSFEFWGLHFLYMLFVLAHLGLFHLIYKFLKAANQFYGLFLFIYGFNI